MLLFSLLATPVLLSALLRKRFETVLPVYVSAVILLMYPMAMVRALDAFIWVAAAVAALCVAWVLVRMGVGQGKLLAQAFAQYTLTPGLLGFTALVILFAAAQSSHVVTATDDIYYWAIEAKSIYVHQGLVDFAHHLSPRFSTYTPGMQLYQWLGAAVAGECSEGLLFVMRATFYAVYLLPLASRISWRKVYWLPLFLLFALAMPALFNRDAYTLLRVDAAMGVCLGYCLIQAWRITQSEQPAAWDIFALSLGLGVLVLTKQVGAAWALMPVSLLFVLSARRRGALRWARLVAVAVPALTVGSWLWFCTANGLSGAHLNSLNANAASLLSGLFVLPEHWQQLPSALWNAFTLAALPLQPGDTTPLLPLPMLAWVALLVLAPLATAFRQPYAPRTGLTLSLWLLTSFALFILGFVGSFLTAFYGEFSAFIGDGGQSLQYLMERYFSPYLLGVLLLGITLFMDIQTRPARRTALLLTAALLGLGLLSNWPSLYANLFPGAYTPSEPEDFSIAQAENFWVDDLEDPLHAIVLYGIDPTPEKRERLQYALFPVKLVTFYDDLPDADFLMLLRGARVTHVLCMDDTNPTYAHAQPFCEDGYMDTFTLYAVTWDGETPVLTP